MKLISLYVENFGGLSRYSLSFEDGLTVIEAENGFGKTTLAEFIRAMFYGFPRKGKTLEKSRRQKYTPWNGGKFGGNLIFEADGTAYRMERTFGATPKGDTFTLIDLTTNKKTTRFTDNIGLELFGLDADAFERSTYLPQMAETGNLTTDSIRSKLSNLVEDTNDVGNFEKAVAALKAKRSTYIPFRGSGGSVAQAAGRINLLQEQLRHAENCLPELEASEKNIRSLEAQAHTAAQNLEQVRADIRQSSEAAAVAAVHRQHDWMQEQWRQARDCCSRFQSRYPGGIPDLLHVEEATQQAFELEDLRRQTVTKPEDLEAEAFLEQNRNRFEDHIPTAEELDRCRSRCGQLSQLRERMVKQAAAAAAQPEAKASLKLLILLLLTCLGALAAGAVLLLKQISFGYIALGAGAVAAVGCVWAAVRLASERKKLQQFRLEKMAAVEEMNRCSAEAKTLADEIRQFLSAYGTAEETDFYDALAELEHDAEDYLQARNRVEQWKQKRKLHEAALNRCRSGLEAFFAQYALEPGQDIRSQLLQIRDDRRAWEAAVRETEELEQELTRFCLANSSRLERPLPQTDINPEHLHQKERKLTEELERLAGEQLHLRQKQHQLREETERIPQLSGELQTWQEKRSEDQHWSQMLDDTVAFLEQAKEELSGSYLGPIRKSFADYLSRLWEEQPGQTLVTQELDVLLERCGQARELGYFSAGQADLVMLCMRFALVDALFGDENPCVILDDPFVNLDDRHAKQALELLKELSENRQILYLTCSSSRTPN